MHLKEFPSKPICLYLLLVYLKARLCRNDSSCLPAALLCLSPSLSLCRVSQGRHWAPAATDPACPSANWEAVPSWWVSAGGPWDRLSPRAAPSLMQHPWDFQVFLEIVGKRWAEMLPRCSPAPAAPWPGPAFSPSDVSALCSSQRVPEVSLGDAQIPPGPVGLEGRCSQRLHPTFGTRETSRSQQPVPLSQCSPPWLGALG